MSLSLLAPAPGVLAQPSPEPAPASSGAAAAEGAPADPHFDPKRSRPLDARTTATRREWLNEDGTVTVEIAPLPVRFKTASGGWREIDLAVEPRGDGTFAARAAGRSARFAPRAGGDVVAIDTAAGRFTVQHPDATGARGEVVDSRGVRYPGGLSGGRDLIERLTVTGFEEEVVLPSAAAGASYRVNFTMPAGISARSGGPGVEFVDDQGRVVGAFGGGLAFDASGSADRGPAEAPVTTALSAVEGRVAQLTVGVDPLWLADPGRAFPVVIDPYATWPLESVTAHNGCQSSYSSFTACDTYGNSDNPTGAYHTQTQVRTGSTGAQEAGSATGVKNRERAFIQFATDNLFGSKIDVETAQLKLYNFEASQPVYSRWTTAYALNSKGVLATTTWGSQPGIESTPASSSGAWQYFGQANGYVSWNVLDTAKRWAAGSLTPYGFALLSGYKVDPAADNPSERDYTYFRKYYSGEAGAATSPLFVMTYNRPPTGATASSPADGALLTTTTPTLAVNAGSDPDGFTLNYRFYVSDAATGAVVADSNWQTGTTFPIPSGVLADGKRYRWSVDTLDSGGIVVASSFVRTFTVDLTAPVMTKLSSSSHPSASIWYARSRVDLSWAASDASGISGYSFLLDQNPSTEPDLSVDGTTGSTFYDRTSGSYWFHVRPRDAAGHWGSPLHLRVNVDVTAPGQTSGEQVSHPRFQNSLDRTIDASWAAASDAHSGVAGYSYAFNKHATAGTDGSHGADTIAEADADDRSITSTTLSDGAWYLHLRTIDQAGNAAPEKVFGPYLIGEATLVDVLLGTTVAGSDELGLEQFAPYDSHPLGHGSSYVQLRTGNAVTQQDLFTIPGQGLNTVARLTHNSHAKRRDSGVGAGWNLSVTDLEGGVEGPLEDLTDASVTDIDVNRDLTTGSITASGLRQDLAETSAEVTGRLVEFVDGDGTTHRFVRQGGAGGRWLSPPGVDLKVREHLDATGMASRYDLVRPDGVTYVATKPALVGTAAGVPVWRVTSVTDRSGNTLTYTHQNFHPNGINRTRLVEIKHNRYTEPIARFSYQPYDATALVDNGGVLRSVTTLPAQVGERRIDLTISDGDHRLTSITEAAHTTVAAGRRTTSYGYHPDGTISAVTDPRGNTTSFAYTAGTPAGYTSTVPMLTAVTDREQARTAYSYATLGTTGGTETTVTRPAGAADEGTNTTRYQISARGKTSDTDDRIAGGNITKVTDAGTTTAGGTVVPVVTSHGWYANKLVKTTDGVGAVTSFAYNDLGLLTSITSPPPNAPGAAALDGAATPTGSVTNTLRYTYPAGFTYPNCSDPAGNGQPVGTDGSCALVAELDRVVTAANSDGQQRVADFRYDRRPASNTGRLEQVIERGDATAAAGDLPRANDRVTRFDYYSRGGLKSIDGPRTDVADITRYGDQADDLYGGYHRSGQPLTLADADGKTKTFAYSPYGMLLSVTDRDQRTTTSRYDERDNLLEATVPGGASTLYSYDANDNKTREQQPARTAGGARPTTEHTFDRMDRLTVVKAPGADESAATPVKTVTSTAYHPDGSQRSVDGPLPGTGDTTVYRYHPNRQLKQTEKPAGAAGAPAVTTLFYDAAGRVVRALQPAADAAGNRPVEALSYSPAGDLQQQASTSTSDGNGTAGNTDKTVDVAFNAHGEPVVTLAPAHDGGKRGREATRYDAFGQNVETRRTVATTLGTKQIVSSTGYDSAGNTVRLTQATGDGGQLESLYRFDALNRLAEQTKDPINPNHKIRYSYNGEGQQTARVDTTATGTVLRRVDSAYNDDNTKRSEIITTADPATPAGQRVLATCNTRPDGTSGYDQAGNLLYSRTVRGPTRADGCAMTDGAALLREQQLSYDDRDWLVSSTMSVRSPATGTMVSRTQRMTYHANGSKASLTHDDGTSTYPVNYAITDAGWESTLTDWRSRTTELSYLSNGSVTRQVLGRGGAQTGGVATADSTYKVDGTLAGLSWTAAGTTVRAHTDISYDNRGLRIREQVSLRQPGQTSNVTGEARYAYDLLDRLTRYTSPHPYDKDETRRPTTDYTLDDGGNITRELTTVPAEGTNAGRTMSDVVSRYTDGRLTSRTGKQTVADLTSPLDLITTDESYTYNDLGEEILRQAIDKYAGADLTVAIGDTKSKTDTSYDAAGHTARSVNEASKPTGTPQTEIDKANADVDYDYDTADRVISRTETKASVTSTTLYFYAGTSGSLIEETDGAGKTKTRYLLDGEGEALAQQTYKVNSDGTSTGTGEKWTWLLNDALGNTATVIDDLGAVIEQKAFDPFGKPENGGTARTTDTDAPITTLGFQSARTDEATGRVMLGQRQYDPSTARFTTPDTYIAGMLDLQLGTDSLTGNRYLFAGANPLAFYEDGHGMFGRLKKIAKASVPALQYVPIVSTAIDVTSAATGRDFYNGGRKLTGGQRMMMLGGAALGVVPGAGAAAKVGLAVANGVNKGKKGEKLASAVAPSCARNSFAPATLVRLADGSSKRIDEVQVGDVVLATDPETGRSAGKPVTELIVGHGLKHLVDVTVGKDNEALTATDGHPFWVKGRGWTLASSLRAGDRLLEADGGSVTIQSVRVYAVSNATVHNLTVADFHTYYVEAAQPVLVHNSACSIAAPSVQRAPGVYTVVFDDGMHYTGRSFNVRGRINSHFHVSGKLRKEGYAADRIARVEVMYGRRGILNLRQMEQKAMQRANRNYGPRSSMNKRNEMAVDRRQRKME